MHLLLLALLAAAQNAPPEKSTISGTVVNAITGEPLHRVQILAEGQHSNSATTPFTTSDVKGNFTLVDLAPGQYRLKAQRNGYLDTYYGSRRAEGKGVPISVESGHEVKGLQFKLVPAGAIAGTIREADGEPLERAAVDVYRVQFQAGRRRATGVEDVDRAYTDDLGQFRITGLPPGRYYVRAEPRRIPSHRLEHHSRPTAGSPEILIPSLHPGVQDPAAARLVEVAAGAKITGVDVVLPRSRTVPVKGRLVLAPGQRFNGIYLKYAGDNDDLGINLEAKWTPDGNFEFGAVPPGSYILTAVALPPAKLSDRPPHLMFYHGEHRAQIPVQVNGLPVEGLRVGMDTGADIEGLVRVADDDPSKFTGRPVVLFENGTGQTTQALVGDDRTFTQNISTGHYSLSLRRSGDFIVRSIQFEGKDILDEGLMISAPGKVSLAIVVARDGGQIDGVVLDGDGKPVAGATVVLVPDARKRSRADLFRQFETDQYGRYQIKNIPPGEYKLFAWDDVEPGIWWDSDFLASYEKNAALVAVKKGAREVIDLRAMNLRE